MRIYDLAKELGKRFNITVKPADLTAEIRDLPGFAGLRDTIKSHASSIEEEVVERVFEIYEERIEGSSEKKAREEEARKKAEEEKRLDELRMRRQQLEMQKQREKESKQAELENIRRKKEEEIRRRETMKIQGRPAAVIPPKPILPTSTPRTSGGISPAVPLPGRKVSQPTGSAPPPTGPRADSATPPPQAQPAAPKVGLRPTGVAAQLKSSSGTSGYSSGPLEGKAAGDTGTAARTGFRADGQPLPPPPPTLRADSPFRMRRAPTTPGSLPSSSDSNRPRQQSSAGGYPAARTDNRGRPPRPGEGSSRPSRPSRPGDRSGSINAPLVIPEIEVMGLKGPTGRKGRSGGGGGEKAKIAPKKKGLKTIVREEIEVKPSKIYGLADEFRRPTLGRKGRTATPGDRAGRGGREVKSEPQAVTSVVVGSTMTVGEFAERIRIAPSEIIKKVFLMGRALTINHLIDPDLCELIAQDYGIAVEMRVESDEQDIEVYRPVEDPDKKVGRSPVVTIMGHVDHGKTTLLDALRSSKVALGEFGGITQHIGAYRVTTPRGMVTFLDTPGHEAFTSMRARGAQVTDVVVLVVAADDGVMPQTVEAINHAREAGVPIIVAVNKIDLPQANSQRVRTELMQHQILPESLGGSNIFVEISAKKKTNLDELLEMLALQTDILELKADPTCRAEGTIIESHVDPLRGAVATVLVSKGTLRIGDIFVVGTMSGRVRGMIDDTGQQIKEAGPSQPVEVIGLSGTPEVGEMFVVMSEERIAREIASRRVDRRRMRDLGTTRHVSLEGLHELVAEGKLKDLKIILKADVQGSLEAVSQSLTKLSNEEVKIRMLHKGVGGVNESDVNLAAASDAIIIGFNVRPDAGAAALAQQSGIEIKTYRVIYELIEEIQKAIVGMLDKKYKEVITGRAEIRQVFHASKRGNIAGCMVTSGEITRGARARIVRDSIVAYDGKIGTLRRVKDDVSKVASGYECGMTFENFSDIKEGDSVEVYSMEEIPLELATAAS